jgi:hypothetical protein
MENSMELNEIPRNGIPLNSMEYFREKIRQMFLWDSMEFRGKFHGIRWNFMELRLMEFNGIPWKIPWNSAEFNGIP